MSKVEKEQPTLGAWTNLPSRPVPSERSQVVSDDAVDRGPLQDAGLRARPAGRLASQCASVWHGLPGKSGGVLCFVVRVGGACFWCLFLDLPGFRHLGFFKKKVLRSLGRRRVELTDIDFRHQMLQEEGPSLLIFHSFFREGGFGFMIFARGCVEVF